MRKLITIAIACFAIACSRKPYVEHKLKFEKVADDCREQQSYFRMISNFGGERYEFERCLPADFNKDQLTTQRKGDTVVVHFKSDNNNATDKVYHITLDIDSYPAYHFLAINQDVYSISSPEK